MAAFTVIDHTEMGASGAASWNVTSIPSSYDHLLIKASLRISNSNEDSDMKIRFNGDTGTNYSATGLYAFTSTPASARQTGQTGITYLSTNGDNSTADTFGNMSVWIPHYSNTANYKQALTQYCVEGATTTDADWRTGVTAGLWSDTSAIDEISLFESGEFYVLMQYSTVTLYGVTGA